MPSDFESKLFERFVSAYIEAALWSSVNDRHYSDPSESESLDSSGYELAPETVAGMRADCQAFWAQHQKTILACDLLRGESDEVAMAGHDFWLTRCRHGAGFWDGDWPEPQATALTEASHGCGEVTLYVGDDDLIYQC